MVNLTLTTQTVEVILDALEFHLLHLLASHNDRDTEIEEVIEGIKKQLLNHELKDYKHGTD